MPIRSCFISRAKPWQTRGMIETLVGLAVVGGVGYLGYRLGKENLRSTRNPVVRPLHQEMWGAMKRGRRISSLAPHFVVDTREQAQQLVDEFLPVLQAMYPNGDANGWVWEVDVPVLDETTGKQRWEPSIQANFSVNQRLDTYDELNDHMQAIRVAAQSLVDFPVRWAGGSMWLEERVRTRWPSRSR